MTAQDSCCFHSLYNSVLSSLLEIMGIHASVKIRFNFGFTSTASISVQYFFFLIGFLNKVRNCFCFTAVSPTWWTLPRSFYIMYRFISKPNILNVLHITWIYLLQNHHIYLVRLKGYIYINLCVFVLFYTKTKIAMGVSVSFNCLKIYHF